MYEALSEAGLKLVALYASKFGPVGDVHLKPLEAGFKLLVNKLHQDRPVACVLRALRFWQDSLKFLDQVGSKPALTVRLSGKQKRPPDIFGYAGRKASCSLAVEPKLVCYPQTARRRSRADPNRDGRDFYWIPISRFSMYGQVLMAPV